jgi:hypothetical protein
LSWDELEGWQVDHNGRPEGSFINTHPKFDATAIASLLKALSGKAMLPEPNRPWLRRVIGDDARIEVYDNRIEIERKSTLSSLLTVGAVGRKSIRIDAIHGVQLKAPGLVTKGYIQFETAGVASRGGAVAAGRDENTVFYLFDQREEFSWLKTHLDSWVPLSSNEQEQKDGSADPLEKIEKLAQLKEKGLITPEEFELAKQKLLADL